MSRLLPPWAAAVFGVALAARLAFWALADQPLLFTHQYHYFTSGLGIATHPDPWGYLLRSDHWRQWGEWTIAPLYHPFEAAVFRLFGLHLEPLRLLQCLMGALTAVAVAAIGRQAAGPHGTWAGLVYAVNAYSVELPTWTLTENLHNLLLSVAMALLLKGMAAPRLGWTAAGGALLGLSALARAVSSAFLPVAAAWRWGWARAGRRWAAAGVLLACGAGVILPWTARNVFIMGDLVPIETTAYENIWYANHFTDEVRWRRQAAIIESQPTPAAKRAVAVHFALRGIRRQPRAFWNKVKANFWHFLRAEGLHGLLIVERPQAPWRHALYVLLEDLPILLLLPAFLAFVFGAPRTPAWALIVLWTAYYLFFEVVVFLNEVPRHRTGFMPLFLPGAVAGCLLLARAGRRPAVWVGLGLGLWISLVLLKPYPAPAWRALASSRVLRQAAAAVERGDLPEGERLATAAAEKAPGSSRPWLTHGRRLAFAGHPVPALAAYDRGAELAMIGWRATVARPRLLLEAGRPKEAVEAVRKADALSWNADPWLVLELAWPELPPPRADEVRVGQGDYGAVRGFLHPRGLDPLLTGHRLEWTRYDLLGGPQPPPGRHRWTRHRAWLRLIPLREAPAHDVTLYMGSPFPSPLTSPEVRVRVNGAEPSRFRLGPEIRPYSLRASLGREEALVVRIDSPTWCRPGEPADQGVRVDRLSVAPAAP